MKLVEFSLILSGVLLNACAQLLLKAGTNRIGHFDFSLGNALPIGWQLATNPYIFGGLSCYVISVVVWIMALSRVPVSIAYPMLSLNFVWVTLAGWGIWHEPVARRHWFGVGLIVVGIVILGTSV